MAISDKPWAQFTEADYTAEQWRRATTVHMTAAAGQNPVVKSLHKVAVREPDGTLNRNGVHAAVGGHGLPAVKGITAAQRATAAKELMSLYHELGEEPPQPLMDAAMMSRSREPREYFDRIYPLEDIEILRAKDGYGDGRTVKAYAAVFNTWQDIHDQHGDYRERNHPSAFNRTIKSGAAMRSMVLYNHGRSVVDGRPDSMASVPLGRPLEISTDSKGLLTVSRYNKDDPYVDRVLEAIRNDAIRSQSYRGRIYRSNPEGRPGRAKAGHPLVEVTRMELGLSDYGPTPMPYYEDAAILSVRARDVVATLSGLDETERAELIRLLSTTPSDPETATATPSQGLGAEDPREAHSGRHKDIARQRQLAIWAELAEMEMATHGQAAI